MPNLRPSPRRSQSNNAAQLGIATREVGTEIGNAMTTTPRYGRRKISTMRRNWNDLRDAVRSGNLEAVQRHFDACEEWIDFSFQHATDQGQQEGTTA